MVQFILILSDFGEYIIQEIYDVYQTAHSREYISIILQKVRQAGRHYAERPPVNSFI